MLSTVANAAATARRWGINALQRNGDHPKGSSTEDHDATSHFNQPMGRGQPLPPPGVPLPRPDRRTPTAPIPVPKRKLLAPPALPKRPQLEDTHEPSTENGEKSPPLPKRRPVKTLNGASRDEDIRSRGYGNGNVNDDGLFVVAAPPVDSEPDTPLGDAHQTYLQPWVADDPEDEQTHKEEVPSI